LCDEIEKEAFRVFDAVRIYEALQNVTAMQPVVVNPSITFTQLSQELAHVSTDEQRALVCDQFIAKLRRKKRHLTNAQLQDFETSARMPLDAFTRQLRTMALPEIAAWFTQNPDLGEILDRKAHGQSPLTYLSDHEDALVGTERGYGRATKPEDYLKEFAE